MLGECSNPLWACVFNEKTIVISMTGGEGAHVGGGGGGRDGGYL